jgi:hypothetical protein
MTDRPGGAARAIRAILLVQLGIAAILFGRDLLGSLPQLGLTTPAPEIDRPIRPGDQTRQYDPAQLPARPPRPGTDVPASGDLPSRLQFERDRAAPELLRLTGAIAPGDAARFSDWLATSGTGVERVRLNSPGGSVADALEIGRALRGLELATEVAAGEICLSACPYLLAAGVTRSAGEEAFIGVHQHYFDENTVLPAFLAVEDIQRGQGEVLTYLAEMGIDPLLMSHALVTPPEEIYLLIREELEKYRLVTEAG